MNKIRKGTHDDEKFLFSLRNSKSALEMSPRSNPISRVEHLEWMQRFFDNAANAIFVGITSDDRSFGYCRFNKCLESEIVYVSIVVDDAFVARGFGTWLLRKSCQSYLKGHDGPLRADIKQSNRPSLAIFKKIGFVPIKRDGSFITLDFPAQSLVHRPVHIDDSELLYQLLLNRTNSISHTNMPTYQEHENFVRNHPYRAWSIVISETGDVLGAWYLKTDNSIGINLLDQFKTVVRQIMSFVCLYHEPLNPIPSVVPPYFFVNASTDNVQLIEYLKEFEFSNIQVSFRVW